MEIFRRTEDKYICTEEQTGQLLNLWKDHIHPDIYYKYTVHSVYLDNDRNDFAIHSLNHPVFKQKLRLRSYEEPEEDSIVYLELKKKSEDIVYKSRIPLTLKEARAYLDYDLKPDHDEQTGKEIDYLMKYSNPSGKVLLLYERECYAADEEMDVRMTFDRHIRYRIQNVSLHETGDEQELLPDQVMLEIKVENRYPLWLIRSLEKAGLTRRSFSKYGNVYTQNFNYFNAKEAQDA